MNRATAFTLLSVFLLNLGGYSMLYWVANRQASKELQATLDRNDLTDQQTFTIKIPITVPYHLNRDYERVTGEFENDGKFYKLVKQRLVNDTLQVVCVVDTKKKSLDDELNNLTRQFSGTSTENGRASKIVNTNPIQEYSSQSFIELASICTGWSLKFESPDHNSVFVSPSIEIHSPPPWA
jgi:hypothetical protein